MEHIRELPSGKCLRKYSPEHPLFEAGTRLWATKYYQEAGSMVQPEDEAPTQAQASSMTCRLANCNVNFQSIVAYEEHYDMMHRNICRECSRPFLSLRLLDIHISETHDAFFKILSKKKPMYVCLVDGCSESFQHDDKRTRHLIQVHQYPKSFSFHQRRKQKGKGNTAERDTTGKQEEDDNPVEVDAETLKKREARKRRRQQKKKKLLGQQGQAKDAEMQVDADATDASSEATTTGSGTTDVSMNELEENMRQMRIPKSVHFGRQRRV